MSDIMAQTLAMLQGGVDERYAALEELAAKPTRKAFRNPGQSAAGAIFNPDLDQNRALLEASLSMLGSDPRDPSRGFSEGVQTGLDVFDTIQRGAKDRKLQAATVGLKGAQDKRDYGLATAGIESRHNLKEQENIIRAAGIQREIADRATKAHIELLKTQLASERRDPNKRELTAIVETALKSDPEAAKPETRRDLSIYAPGVLKEIDGRVAKREGLKTEWDDLKKLQEDLDAAAKLQANTSPWQTGGIGGRVGAWTDAGQDLETLYTGLGLERLANFKGSTSEKELEVAFRAGPEMNKDTGPNLEALGRMRKATQRSMDRVARELKRYNIRDEEGNPVEQVVPELPIYRDRNYWGDEPILGDKPVKIGKYTVTPLGEK